MKIMHTADLHIGMKYNRYPDGIRDKLAQARISVLRNMVDIANTEGCNIFAIAGDLFENIKINKSLVIEVVQILRRFEGECVLVLPGNHDYEDGLNDLWKRFREDMSDRLILLNQNRVYNLQAYDLNVKIYPACCNQKHSETNNIGWMAANGPVDEKMINLGIAHGTLEGTSADLEGNYYFMSRQELAAVPMDLWLLGHSHVRYPDVEECQGQKIFNSGTPEPDGMNSNRIGNAWIIDIQDDKSIRARSVKPGQYQFLDLAWKLEDEDDFNRLSDYLLDNDAAHKLVRLYLSGSLDEALLEQRRNYYQVWEQGLLYLTWDDSELRRKVNWEIIEREFTIDSFPYRWLQKLADDPETLQLAYELIRQVR